ncbi:MAG: cysteine synthase A [Bacilli bacterium]|nr:cysteine synthase A [Bacilli bacterium]
MLVKDLDSLIGNTPLLEVEDGIYAKLEMFNPSGSIKARIAKNMIEEAIRQKKINQDTLIIEPTSGNTGIGLAFICALKGLKCMFVMPESMSIERRNLLKAYGAKLVLTSAKGGMSEAVFKANELHHQIENSFIPSQFENEANPNIHYLTTGKEIYHDLNGNIDCFVCGVGTGGTLSGVGKYLKEQNSNIKIVAVEPLTSPILSKNQKGPHKIQGIGAGFIPQTLNTNIYDEIIMVSDEDAINETKVLAKKGILVGISSGANMYAAKLLRKKYKMVVTTFADSLERYLSSDLFKEEE